MVVGAAFVSGWFGAGPASAALAIEDGSTLLVWRSGTLVVGGGFVDNAGSPEPERLRPILESVIVTSAGFAESGAIALPAEGEWPAAGPRPTPTDGCNPIDGLVGVVVAGNAVGGVISLAIGRGTSDGDGSAGGAFDFSIVDFSTVSPQQVGPTWQQQVQQRRLSKRQAEAGSIDKRQTLIQARVIVANFRSRFIA